ncbi:hypothetical protein IL38_11925 [Actinopolyspora erythraea]|nr:peptidoglycan-binding domain-containing protein [Actinopolyspora erythraea]KGI81208.1 hypothetical protein IL38_11925 [Actinopolyspora erythraea]
MFRLIRPLVGSLAAALLALPVLLGSAAALEKGERAAALALPTCTRTSWTIPATESGDMDCLLSRGVANRAVSSLQDSLNRCHGFSLAIDGIYGANTAAAVRSVQSSAGIAVDGVYGPNTRDVMRWGVNGCQS